jgi:hypothetical protein
MRQGGDPRLPLELALVKVTRPQSDLQRESLAHRVELLEAKLAGPAPAREPAAEPLKAGAEPKAPPVAENGGNSGQTDDDSPEVTPLQLAQLQDAWQRSVIPAAQEKAIWIGPLLGEATPSALEGNVLTLEFPRTAEFHREKLEEPRNLDLVRDALHEVTGRRLSIATTVADAEREPTGGDDEPLDESSFIALLKDELGAKEVEDT